MDCVPSNSKALSLHFVKRAFFSAERIPVIEVANKLSNMFQGDAFYNKLTLLEFPRRLHWHVVILFYIFVELRFQIRFLEPFLPDSHDCAL